MPRDKQTGLLQENKFQQRQRVEGRNSTGTCARNKKDPHQVRYKETDQVHQ